MKATQLEGPRVTLRPVGDDDLQPLAEILLEPAVAGWWGERDADYVRDKIVGDPDATVWAIEAEGELIGLIQCYEEPDPEYRHAAVDLFLTGRVHGRGLGPEAIRVLARHLVEDRGHHRLTIDPAAANKRAIRAYEKVGFRPVGVMRRYERAPDGNWRDGLLMDLLAEDLAAS
jgi:aminoglycoside 6'-N-acetyltransferase